MTSDKENALQSLSAPQVSIVVPVYNVEDYLHRCLNSILAQTLKDWECICVDDGSTDGSGQILDEYAAKDSRFIVIHQQNGGRSAARNVGIEKASGEYIGFVDSDDWIESETYELALAAAKHTGADIVEWNITVETADGPRPLKERKEGFYNQKQCWRGGGTLLYGTSFLPLASSLKTKYAFLKGL